MPYQAPPPRPPPKNLGKGWNPAPPVPLEPTPPGLTPSESESDNFYLPRTPPLRSPQADPDSLHRFFNPNPGLSNDPLYDSKTISYAPDGSPSNIQYNYTRHGRQLSWDWHNLTSMHYHGVSTRDDPASRPEGWWRLEGRPDLDNSVFEEFLRQGQWSHQTSTTPAGPRQPPSQGVNPPRHSGRQRQPTTRPDNVYGDEVPVDILWNYDAFDVTGFPVDQSPDRGEGPSSGGVSNALALTGNSIEANISWEGGQTHLLPPKCRRPAIRQSWW